MEAFKEAVERLKEARTVLICGGECSGKTRAMGELVRELSMEFKIQVFSTHREIKTDSLKPDNVEVLYKSKSSKVISLEYLDKDCDFIFVDEECDNIDEIVKNMDNHLVFVKSIKDRQDINGIYDLILIISKDKNGNILYTINE